ncbi:MAG: hypothetical protein DRH32_01525 [Deltaproteobacteria bacterium]|nr:MAG: hypothetical protein DRH32_01525 [Deltaproteobacteria bacterium]
MIFKSFKIRGVFCRYILLFVLLTAFGFLVSGCSMVSDAKKKTSRIVRNFKSPDRNLSRKIGIALFEDEANLTDRDYAMLIQTGLATAIGEECPQLRLMRQGQKGYPRDLSVIRKPADGRMDIFSLISVGRKHGFDAIVDGRLLDITSTEKKHGFLWFRDTTRFLQVQILVEIYDMETGAKLLDETFRREIEVDAMNATDSFKNTYGPAISTAAEELLPVMGQKICDVISARAWHGFVVSTQGGKITISAGEKAGLKAGDELALFSGARTIKGQGGQQFMTPGLKSGKIRITTVFPESSEAILVEGEAAGEGDVVKTE